MTKKISASFHCPSEFTLDVLGGKWKTVILCYLKERPLRYAELRKLVPKLSDKVLTERLHELKDKGLIAQERIRSERSELFYTLTAQGNSLRPLLTDLNKWGLAHAAAFGVTVGQPLKALKTQR